MLLAAGLVFGGALFSQAQKSAGGEKSPVDVRALSLYSDRDLNLSLGIDERAQILVGDVAFHHNGAVISCDSAVRYYATNRIDCFKNVIINKDSIFVYGDAAEYNGDANLARVYSPVVKVVDGDATLYTTRMFSFNTADNIGTWNGGGVVYQQDNVMESERGFYYSDLHELVAVRGVQMKNDTHQIISDSVRYNTETKVAEFYTRTYIWTEAGEMISALAGRYNTRDSTYFFRDSAYILDEFRETWADTIDYAARNRNAVFYGNIQIDDREHDSSAFGDMAHYWGERGETRLTRRPSMLNYDADQGNTDTLYMRADTLYMFVRYPSDSRRADSLDGSLAGGVGGANADRFAHLKWVDLLPNSVRVSMADSLAGVIAPLRAEIARLRTSADSIMNALYPPVTPAEVPDEVQGEVQDTDALPDTSPAASSAALSDALPNTSPDADLPGTDSVFTADPIEPDSVLVADSAEPEAVADSLFVMTAPVPRPEIEAAEPENLETPEVTDLRAQASTLAARIDSLAAVEGYIRPRAEGRPRMESTADSLARLQRDSLARVDSLVRIDSIRVADPRTYKALRKAENRRHKAVKARLAAEQREQKYAQKAIDREEKARLRAERRAEKRAEKAAKKAEKAAAKAAARAERVAAKTASQAEKITARRRSMRRAANDPLLDSLARAGSSIGTDSLSGADSTRLDSLLRLDSIMLDSLAPTDSLPQFDSLLAGDSTATAIAEPDTTRRIFRGWPDVRIWRTDMQAVCDSMVGFSLDSTVHMYKNPILWHADSQITGDSMVLHTAGQQIEHAEFFGNPIMGSQLGDGAGAVRRFNQVKGDRMASWFRDGGLYRHDADGNAQALYYMQEDRAQEDGRTVLSDARAFIVMSAASMSFLFEADSLRYIVARQGVPYTVYPMDQIPGSQPTQLQGFVWRADRKPTLTDVFDRTVRPSEREFYETLPRPEFPIAARIDRRREYLIENRMWADRTDPLPAYAVEFRRDRYREEVPRQQIEQPNPQPGEQQ
jgi:hypothetical protein